MKLTPVEKERIADSKMKIQSITNSLKHVDPKKLSGFDDIQDCMEDADKSLDEALRSSDSSKPTGE